MDLNLEIHTQTHTHTYPLTYIYLESVNCALKLFLLENVLNQFDLITSSLDFLIFNFNLSSILLLEGYLFGVPGP